MDGANLIGGKGIVLDDLLRPVAALGLGDKSVREDLFTK
jgi:hypothetical protein